MSNVDLFENRPLADYPTVPVEDVCAEAPYIIHAGFLSSYFTVGTRVYVPRWENGEVLHYEVGEVLRIVVTAMRGKREVSAVVRHADGREVIHFDYSIGAESIVNLLAL